MYKSRLMRYELAATLSLRVYNGGDSALPWHGRVEIKQRVLGHPGFWGSNKQGKRWLVGLLLQYFLNSKAIFTTCGHHNVCYICV